MEKSKVIEAYRLGLLSFEECAQVLGMDNRQLHRILANFPENEVNTPFLRVGKGQAK